MVRNGADVGGRFVLHIRDNVDFVFILKTEILTFVLLVANRANP